MAAAAKAAASQGALSVGFIIIKIIKITLGVIHTLLFVKGTRTGFFFVVFLDVKWDLPIFIRVTSSDCRKFVYRRVVSFAM